MIRINQNYLKLQSSYLFSEIDKRVNAFQKAHPDREIIKMGIGDITRALPPACIQAFHQGVDEMADDATMRGYGPEHGYPFLRELIAEADFQSRNADITAEDIFISDGAKTDTANFQELFSGELTVAVPDPVYPVYVDTNVMAGRTGIWKDGRYQGMVYLESTRQNGFVPEIPAGAVDLIYLCYPNNPTGAVISLQQLQAWVDYARRERALILYDAAYEAFIRDDAVPKTIYEAEGAQEVAVEFRSFSKTAGFTGTRCAYTVVPEACRIYDKDGTAHALNPIWNRRQTTKMNGVSYPVQRAAAAVFGPEGQKQTRDLIDGYLENARIIRESLEDCGLFCSGGENSPYVWVQAHQDSWEFFSDLLEKSGVVCTPGAGFGRCGEGYARFSAFNSRENVVRAMDHVTEGLKSS